MNKKEKWTSRVTTGDDLGGGLHSYELGDVQHRNLVFGEGLRVPKPEWSMFEHDTLFYQKKGYVRGAIWHHRSNATQ